MVDKNPLKIKNMFDNIAKNYDYLNNIISFGLHKIIKRKAFKSIKINKNSKILDLCTGTGDVAQILKNMEPTAEIVGLDFSNNMLKIAKEQNKDINFIQGDVCGLKFEDNYFDVVTMSFGLRNIENLNLAITQINRILKTGGIFAHLDFSPQNNIFNRIFDKTTLLFAKIFSRNYEAYKYLIESKKEFKKINELISEFEQHGFKCILKKDFLFNTINFCIVQKYATINK